MCVWSERRTVDNSQENREWGREVNEQEVHDRYAKVQEMYARLSRIFGDETEGEK